MFKAATNLASCEWDFVHLQYVCILYIVRLVINTLLCNDFITEFYIKGKTSHLYKIEKKCDNK